MNVKLIGTGAIYTRYNSACTLIDNKMMVDMPNGTLKQLLKEEIDPCGVEILLVTHMHGDHIADIPFFLKYVYSYRKSKNMIKVIGPIGIKKKIFELFQAYNFESEEKCNDLFYVEFIEVLESDLFIEHFDITTYLVMHGEEKPALGYTINKELGITGDSGICQGVEQIFRNANLILCDASLIEGDEKHLGINDLKYLSEKYHKKIICTHLRDQTRKAILNKQLDNIVVCEDFFEIEI